MTGVREEKKRAVRTRLYKAALHLIEAKGYDAVTAAEIATAAGVAKGTLFNHFPTKAHFIADWYAGRTEDALLASARSAQTALSARLTELALAVIDACADNPEMWAAKRSEGASCDAIRRVEAETDAAIRARAEKLTAQARQAGAVRADVDPAAFADLYTALVSGTTAESAATGAFDLRERVGDRVAAICNLVQTSLDRKTALD